jgi:hypothetical protein
MVLTQYGISLIYSDTFFRVTKKKKKKKGVCYIGRRDATTVSQYEY